MTPRIIDNMKNSFGEADDLDGFDELKDEDQERVQKAWEEGHVADEDIPDSARKPAGNGENDEDDEGEKERYGSHLYNVRPQLRPKEPQKRYTDQIQMI